MFYPSNENYAAMKTKLICIHIEQSQGDIKKMHVYISFPHNTSEMI